MMLSGLFFLLWLIFSPGLVVVVDPDYGSIINVIFPLLTVVAGGVAILAYGSNKVLRDTSADLRQRVQDLEHDRDTLLNKVNAQAAELSVWQKAVTGEVQLTAILDLLGDHHKEAIAEWARNRATQGEMTKALHDLTRTIVERMKDDS